MKVMASISYRLFSTAYHQPGQMSIANFYHFRKYKYFLFVNELVNEFNVSMMMRNIVAIYTVEVTEKFGWNGNQRCWRIASEIRPNRTHDESQEPKSSSFSIQSLRYLSICRTVSCRTHMHLARRTRTNARPRCCIDINSMWFLRDARISNSK